MSRCGASRLDGRTRIGKLVRDVRATLVAAVGGTPNALSRITIDRVAMLMAHIQRMDDAAGTAGGMPEHERKVYLDFVRQVRRHVRDLDLRDAEGKPQTINDLLAGTSPAPRPETETRAAA
jgi:hypothetical protein